jgi:LysM repeat protein
MALDKQALNDENLDQVSGGTILRYRVQPGDNLNAIAQKYHVSVEQLMQWNKIKDPNEIVTSQQLKIKF